MHRKHLFITSIVVLIAAAVWSVEFIAPRHYRLPATDFDSASVTAPVFMVNGLKVGEVSSVGATVVRAPWRSAATASWSACSGSASA